MTDGFPAFEYAGFTKTALAGARFPLAFSGVSEVPASDLADPRDPVPIEGSELGGALRDWRARIAARYGVPADHAHVAFGTSGAAFLALTAIASLLPPGAKVAVERPGYGVFESIARLAGRDVVHVDRRPGRAWSLELGAVENAFLGGARVLCLTDLHNPTGAALADAAVEALHEIAQRYDGWVLLDEVYRDFLPGPVGTAYRAGSRVVVISSLTKCYGLGGLRAGWIFADPHLLARAAELESIAYGSPPAVTVRLAERALARADEFLARGRAAAAAGRAVIDFWVASTPNVSWIPPAAGITGLLRVEGVTDSKRFAARLREELGVQVVPGAHFGAEGSIRVSFGRPVKELEASLCVLAMGISALRS